MWLFLPGEPNTTDHRHAGEWGQSLAQHRRSSEEGAIGHHLHETLRYAMPKLHKCCFVFINSCCLLHKFHYP